MEKQKAHGLSFSSKFSAMLTILAPKKQQQQLETQADNKQIPLNKISAEQQRPVGNEG
jgi:hypothetical protein